MNTTQYITVIPPQNQVIVDGVSKLIPNLDKDLRLSGISAIQWPGDGTGHIEINEAPWYYEIKSDSFLSDVAPYLAMWEKQVAEDKEKQAKRVDSIDYKANKLLNIRKRELAATDFIVLPDYEADAAVKEKAIEYRKWLRDITKLPGYPWDGGGKETPWPEAYPWAGK